jgi:hypothetical protein
MDKMKLRRHAELLEATIHANLGKSKELDWLAQYPPLIKALDDAKEERIDTPRNLGSGLNQWVFESNIQEFYDLSERLAEFNLLLKGWTLPSELFSDNEGRGQIRFQP